MINNCGCASSRPCSTGRCGYVLAQMSCSIFCDCHAVADCSNHHTRNTSSQDDEHEEGDV